MRTGTGVIDTVFSNGMAKVRTNRDNLYTPCSGKMCNNNTLIDVKNTVGASKGQFVKFNIPDDKMGAGGAMCFGIPTLLVILLGAVGYWLGMEWNLAKELASFAGMVIGGIIGALLLKHYEKRLRKANTLAEVTEILVEKTNETEE